MILIIILLSGLTVGMLELKFKLFNSYLKTSNLTNRYYLNTYPQIKPTITSQNEFISKQEITTITFADPINNPTKKIIKGIPFVIQDPQEKWIDPRLKFACEEALMLMTWHWIKSEQLQTKNSNKEKILDLIKWQEENYGEYLDTSINDTALRFAQYFNYNQVQIKQDLSLNEIKQLLDSDQVIWLPVDGRQLSNPHFKAPGPYHHLILIKGYDDKTEEFITNDPGTSFGEDWRYDYREIMLAWRDYPTGLNKTAKNYTKKLIVISRF